MNTVESTVPRPATARELKAVLDVERTGTPFLLYRDGAAGQCIVVLDDPSRLLTLGRGERNDVLIDWDPAVSAVHAELQCTGGVWTVADDGLSSNGTYVNGSRLGGRQRLRDGDHLRLGRTVLVYRSSEAAPTPGTAVADDVPTVEHLSDTQRRVLIALCRPYGRGGSFVTPATNQAIASELYLSVDAVKNHLRVLFAKFDLDGLPQNQKRAQLAETALRWGLVSQRDL
jgi:pSer/pThr/pTyr-binding forkhead associated (FHA) protein